MQPDDDDDTWFLPGTVQSAPEGSAPNRRILIIDDNPRIHDDFRTILVREGEDDSYLADLEAELFGEPETPARGAEPSFELDSAYQGREGLEKVRAALDAGRPYAMAFVDVRMPPGWDGIETIRHLWDADPLLQVVICTAYSDYSWEETLERLAQPERFLILKKPFDTVVVRQLAHSLTEKWDRQRLSREEVARLREQVEAQARDLATAAAQREAATEAPHPISAPAGDVPERVASLIGRLRAQAALREDAPPSALAAIATELEAALVGLPEAVLQAARGLPSTAEMTRELRDIEPTRRPAAGPTVLNQAVARALDDTMESWRGAVVLSVDYGPTATLPHPPDEVATVIRELLHNAVLAVIHDAPVGAPKGTLRVRTALEGDHVVLEVADSGPGIAPSLRERVFDAWYSTWDRDGQGLTVVCQILAEHGGTAEVAPSTEGGARLVIRWPTT